MINMLKRFWPVIILALLITGNANAYNIVKNNAMYVPNPSKSGAIGLGTLYVGEPDTDPTVLANQKQIYVKDEAGTVTPVSQPLTLGAGGVPLYNGDPVTVLTDGSYSMMVKNSFGSQIYYIPSDNESASISVDTIASLRLITPTSGQYAIISGYYAATDGAGGPPRIGATGAAPGTYVDNGGAIIVPTGGNGSAAWLWGEIGTSHISWWGGIADDSVDDYARIKAAHDYYKARTGGVIDFDKGEYDTTDTIVVDSSSVFFRGKGGGTYFSTLSAATVTTPATMLKYIGVQNEPVISFTYVANDWPRSGGGMSDFFIHCGDGAGVASIGLKVVSRRKTNFKNIVIFNPTEAQLKTSCEWGSVQHCLFENMSGAIDPANTTGKGLVLTGGQGGEWNGSIQTASLGNTAFNTFINTRWASNATQPAVQLQNTDNNSFYALRANGGGTEEPITVGALELGCAEDDESGEGGVARYNNFFGVEAVGGVFAKASQTGAGSSHHNNIYGYNISNGGIRPLIQTGAGGSDDATLGLYGGNYNYLPNENILPAEATIDFTATSGSYADSRTVTYSKAIISEQGNLNPAPTIVGTTAAGVGTYSVASGSYELNNSTCRFTMRLVWSAHTGTGNMQIAGLPFLSVTSANLTPVNVAASNLTFPGQIIGLVDSNAKTLTLYTFATGGAITALPMDTAGTLYISGSYRAVPQ